MGRTSAASAIASGKVADSVKVPSFTTSGTYAVVSKDDATMELYLKTKVQPFIARWTSLSKPKVALTLTTKFTSTMLALSQVG